MACFSTSSFLWLCGNNAFPSCSHRWWTSGLFPAFGYCDRWCWWALVFKFPCEYIPRSTPAESRRLLSQLFSSLLNRLSINPLPLDSPFTLTNILPKCPQHSWVSRCATIFWLAACVCSSMLSAVLRFNMVGAGSFTYVSSGFRFQNLSLSHLILSGPCFYLFMFLSFFLKRISEIRERMKAIFTLQC